jgi:hypothetical protein
MKTPTKRDDSGVRRAASKVALTAAARRGAPPTVAAHAVRKDVTVRVSLKQQAPPEGEELREEGYGHGV